MARIAEKANNCTGATLGSVNVAGALWRQTACAAGLAHMHGVDDGAD